MINKITIIMSLSIVTAIALTACVSEESSTSVDKTPTSIEETLTTVEAVETEKNKETEEFKEPESPELESPATGLVCTVSLWHSLTENEMESLKEVAAAFQEMNPNVEFDFLYTPNSDIKSKFEAAVAEIGRAHV